MQFQLWLTVTWVYTSRPAPSVALYYRLLTASAHRCIVVECIVRAYFVLIYYLLVTCFISILTNNAIVLYYFVDSYKQLLLLHIMGIPAMMVMVPGGTSCWRRHACTTTQLVMLLVRSFIYLYALMIETCTSSCDWQSSCGCIHHILLLRPSVVTLHRLLTTRSHRYIIALECMVEVYFISISYLLLVTSPYNAIVLYYFVDSYIMELLLFLMVIPAMMVKVPGGATSC